MFETPGWARTLPIDNSWKGQKVNQRPNQMKSNRHKSNKNDNQKQNKWINILMKLITIKIKYIPYVPKKGGRAAGGRPPTICHYIVNVFDLYHLLMSFICIMIHLIWFVIMIFIWFLIIWFHLRWPLVYVLIFQGIIHISNMTEFWLSLGSQAYVYVCAYMASS